MPNATRSNLPLTDKQDTVWRFAHSFREKKDYSPSVEEIAAATGFPVSSVQSALRALEVKGYVHRIPGVARGLVILRKPK